MPDNLPPYRPAGQQRLREQLERRRRITLRLESDLLNTSLETVGMSCFFCGGWNMPNQLVRLTDPMIRSLLGRSYGTGDTTLSMCFSCLNNTILCDYCHEYHAAPLRSVHPDQFFRCVMCGVEKLAQPTDTGSNYTFVDNIGTCCVPCLDTARRVCDDCGGEYFLNWTSCTCATILAHGGKPAMRYYDKRLTPHSKPKDRTLYLGVELEVECARTFDVYDPDKEVHKMVKASKLPLFCKYDGSLSNGVEIVSMPLTFDAWLGFWDRMTKLYADLQQFGCRAYATNTCGLHIHASKAGFHSLGHLYRVARFMYSNKSKLIALSQRGPNAIRRWASFEDVPTSSIVSVDNLKPLKAEYFLARKVKHPETSSRYTALNLQPRDTAEFRLFKGTLYPAAIKRALETVQSLRDYTLGTSMIDGEKWSQFLAFLATEKKIFPELHAWAVENKHDADKQEHAY